MPVSSRETLLCRYHYDPLDRQHGCTLPQQSAVQRFYCKSRLASEIQGQVHWSIIQHDDQLLALRQAQSGTLDTALLATDQQRSVVNALANNQPHPIAYLPYGHRPAENGLFSLLGFNGERPDPVTGHYHLGNGYRQFNPVLMRFNSPDSWSPFGEGGLNAYGYCAGNPINRVDPSGHKWLSNALKLLDRRLKANPNQTIANQGISQSTINSVAKTVKALGGEKNIKGLAKKQNIDPTHYLINKMPETKPLPPRSEPYPNGSKPITAMAVIQDFQNHSSQRIKFLEERAAVQKDLIYGGPKIEKNGNLHIMQDLLLETKNAIDNEMKSSRDTLFDNKPPAFEKLRFDPLPSYQSAIRQ